MITGYRLKFDEMKLRKILEFNFEDFYSPPENGEFNKTRIHRNFY